MQEQRKSSVGSAIVDVFDAGVALVKAEINSLIEKLAELAKAKGLGVVIILAALAPLTLFAIFFILAIYFGLVAAGMPWWGAALLMAVVSLVLAVGMVLFGMSKLSEKLSDDQAALSEDERLEAEYLAEKRRQRQNGEAVSGAVVTTGIPATLSNPTVHAVQGDDIHSLKAEAASSYTSAELGRPSSAAQGSALGYERPSTDGAHTIPVFDAGEDGEAQFYGSGLNDKLGDDHHANDHHHDPDVVHPERLEGAEEIEISTAPTYREDMERGQS